MQTENSSGPSEAERLLERAGAAGWWLPALEVLAWVVFFAFAGVFLTLRYWLLPHIGRYRGEIAAELSRSIGLPVKIGSISAEWQGLRPHVHLGDVRLYDHEGRVALALPSVDNVVSWQSLLHLDLRLYSLVIEAPRLEVRRDAQGALYVAGLKLGGARGGEGGFAAWLLAQREVRVRDAEITWTDAKRAAPPLRLLAVNLRVRNRGAQHALGLAARLPPALGNRIELRAALVGGAAQALAAWGGEVYVALGETDLAGWRAWVDYPLDVRSGRGALRLWAGFAGGRLRSVTADVALADVTAQLGPDLAPLRLASVHGRLEGAVRGAGYELAVSRLALATGEGTPMRSTSFTLRWRPAAGGAPARGALEAERLELAPLARLAGALPLPAQQRALLEQLAPRGELLGARLDWRGALPDAASFAGQARFAGLGMNAWHEVPGFAGLAGSVNATERGGTLRLDARDATVDLPKVFPQPRIALDALEAEAEWSRAPGTLRVRVSKLDVANAHLAGSASGSYVYTGAGPGTIDLSARFRRVDGRFTARYLPRAGIVDAKLRDWLTHAVVAGDASDVRLRLQGDLRRFPFAAPGSGQFRISARVRHGVLDVGHGWPRIQDIDAELAFAGDDMHIVAHGAKILGAQVTDASASIAGLSAPRHELVVSGHAAGPSDEFLRFLRESPLRRVTGGVTAALRARGNARLSLQLKLPIEDLARSQVAGVLSLSDNSLRVRPGLPPLEHLNGTVAFTESSLALRAMHARLLDEPVTIGGGWRHGEGLDVTAHGAVSIAALRKAFAEPWWEYLSGTTPYAARITQRNGVTVVGIETPLTGIASRLPAPLAKSADRALPLHVEFVPSGDETRERIAIRLGDVLRAELLRVRDNGAMTLQRAAVALYPKAGTPVRLPERPGTLVYGALARLDLDRWLPLFRGQAPGASMTSLELKLGVLDAFGKQVHDVALRAGTDRMGWSAHVQAKELTGDLGYRYGGGGELVARLKHFQIPPDAPGAPSGGGIKDLPAVNLSAESFTFRGKQLGRVAIVAQREGADWRVDRIALTDPDASLKGHGAWHTAQPSRTSFDFQLDVGDVGKFAARIGYPGVIKGGSATLAGRVSWQGDPLALDYPSLSGRLELHAKNGQFLEVNPGVGKLFSLMSLQMLPRRVTLDFRDVFSKGFAFERIASSLQLEDGVMNTDDFHMSGSAADVDMSGEVNLARETQDLKVRVVPSVGDSASTVLGLVNPIVGVTSFIAQHLLKNPLGQMFAYRYAITGSWNDPDVKKLQPVTVPLDELPAGY